MSFVDKIKDWFGQQSRGMKLVVLFLSVFVGLLVVVTIVWGLNSIIEWIAVLFTAQGIQTIWGLHIHHSSVAFWLLLISIIGFYYNRDERKYRIIWMVIGIISAFILLQGILVYENWLPQIIFLMP